MVIPLPCHPPQKIIPHIYTYKNNRNKHSQTLKHLIQKSLLFPARSVRRQRPYLTHLCVLHRTPLNPGSLGQSGLNDKNWGIVIIHGLLQKRSFYISDPLRRYCIHSQTLCQVLRHRKGGPATVLLCSLKHGVNSTMPKAANPKL